MTVFKNRDVDMFVYYLLGKFKIQYTFKFFTMTPTKIK